MAKIGQSISKTSQNIHKHHQHTVKIKIENQIATVIYKIAFSFVLLSISSFCAVGLHGCSLAPTYKQPPLPVASTYPSNTQNLAKNTHSTYAAAADTDWRDYFADPYLQKLIALGLENNRDLRIAILRVQEAQATYHIERANQFPTIAAGADAGQTHIPGDLTIGGRIRDNNLFQTALAKLGFSPDDLSAGLETSETNSQYQVALGFASWELDFWGRVRSLKTAALENYLATDAARCAATVSLINQIAENYLVLRELNERILLAKQTIANHQKSYNIFSKRVKAGATAQIDLYQIEILLTEAKSLDVQLEQARDTQLHILTQLIGTSPPPLSKNTRFNDKIVMHKLRVGLPSALLISRPDIIAAEHQLKAAGANIGAARAAFFPNITLTSSFGTASTDLGGLFQSGSEAWNFAPSLTLPIFDAGRNRATLNLAEVRKNIAVANYEKTIQIAFREVSDALTAHDWLTKQLHIQQKTLAAEQERSRLAELRYNNGATPYLEVLDAQRDLLTAQQQLVQTRRTLLSSHIRLYAALGGSSQSFISTPQSSNNLLNLNKEKKYAIHNPK